MKNIKKKKNIKESILFLFNHYIAENSLYFSPIKEKCNMKIIEKHFQEIVKN